MNFYFDVVSESGVMAEVRTVAGFILSKNIERFTRATLTQGNWHCKKNPEAIAQILDPLEAYGWIMPADLNEYPSRAWVVNPEVHKRFAQRAQEETTRRQGLREMIRENIRSG